MEMSIEDGVRIAGLKGDVVSEGVVGALSREGEEQRDEKKSHGVQQLYYSLPNSILVELGLDLLFLTDAFLHLEDGVSSSRLLYLFIGGISSLHESPDHMWRKMKLEPSIISPPRKCKYDAHSSTDEEMKLGRGEAELEQASNYSASIVLEALGCCLKHRMSSICKWRWAWKTSSQFTYHRWWSWRYRGSIACERERKEERGKKEEERGFERLLSYSKNIRAF
ncbi:hypothetical protein ACLOJK_002268 [Asimina triloba]